MRANGFSPDTATIKPIKENLGHRDLKECPSRVGDCHDRYFTVTVTSITSKNLYLQFVGTYPQDSLQLVFDLQCSLRSDGNIFEDLPQSIW